MTEAITRRILLEGCANFRDLGGYPTADGRTVKWRRLFRADAPNTLTEADVQSVTGDLGISAVIDLRNSDEVLTDGRGLLALSGIGYHHFPFIERRGLPPPTDGEDSERRLTEIYQWMLHNSGTLMAQAFTTLSHEINHPAVFHCSAGKDRTGVLAATILAVLGVRREDVIADYLMTNDVIDDILARIKKMPGFENSTRAGQMVQKVAIEKFLDAAETEYGGAEAYLRRQGVQQSTIDSFRASLLE